MIKLFVTGDVHIGKKYDSRYPVIKDLLIRSRFECLERCVEEAEKEHCDFFVITGDLFDNTHTISQRNVKEVVDILSRFGGYVLVLPGNHDFYTGEEKVWNDFAAALSNVDHNIILFTEFKEQVFETGEETVAFYPAFCDSKHSDTNNLEWIRSCEMDTADYHVGLAHGSIAGFSPDPKGEYFLMTEKELNAIPVDTWLIGHTHIPYPDALPVGKDVSGYRIFNAGTPEQMDLSNNTEGLCFVISLEHRAGQTAVLAHSVKSGTVRYFDRAVKAGEGNLEQAIKAAVKDMPERSIVRLTVSGAVSPEEYADRGQFYDEALNGFLSYEIVDSELSELITREKIRSEFAEIGFAAAFLESLKDPKEIQMAYELIKKYQS